MNQELNKFTDKNELISRLTLEVFGIVQGVGFRPAIYRSAKKQGFSGFVKNCTDHVKIILEGPKASLRNWLENWTSDLPAHARVDRINFYWDAAIGLKDFVVEESEKGKQGGMPIPPDMITCEECKTEFYSPNNRRYLYPFIACTYCGPRYSIIRSLPYDRANTSMERFPFCKECQKEYDDPTSRRFHTENFACADCGPTLELKGREGLSMPKLSMEITTLLKNGQIGAIKGIGGFQLICDAKNPAAIRTLRERKNRPHQSLAVMARCKELLHEGPEKTSLLTSAQGPIVVVDRDYGLPVQEIAPDTGNLGIFLPTSPIHYLLFGERIIESPLDFLICTSGNQHGIPMASEENDAYESLAGIADFFIIHNRPIVRPVDDSVFGMLNNPMRLSRGFTPFELKNSKSIPQILAMGADLKNTFLLSKENSFYLSPHIGDLFEYKTYCHYEKSIEDLISFYDIKPQLVVVDLHPQYASRIKGIELAKKWDIKYVEVQHHEAHATSLMSEYHLDKLVCLTFDGTGYGRDGILWGGECFLLDRTKKQINRLATMKPSALIGGENAIKEPWRQLATRCLESGLTLPSRFSQKNQATMLKNVFHQNLDVTKTSSIGRLFDSVASLLMEEYDVISYEGQGAIGLEKLAVTDFVIDSEYLINYQKINDLLIFDSHDLFKQVYLDYQNGIDKRIISKKFHIAIARVGMAMLKEGKKIIKTSNAGISGGVFQNSLLVQLLKSYCEDEGFNLYIHQKVPTNDGGIALGQANYIYDFYQAEDYA